MPYTNSVSVFSKQAHVEQATNKPGMQENARKCHKIWPLEKLPGLARCRRGTFRYFLVPVSGKKHLNEREHRPGTGTLVDG
jgi:hypothetical protein